MTNRFGSVPVGDGSGAESLRSNLEAGADDGAGDASRQKSAERSSGTFTARKRNRKSGKRIRRQALLTIEECGAVEGGGSRSLRRELPPSEAERNRGR